MGLRRGLYSGLSLVFGKWGILIDVLMVARVPNEKVEEAHDLSMTSLAHKRIHLLAGSRSDEAQNELWSPFKQLRLFYRDQFLASRGFAI